MSQRLVASRTCRTRSVTFGSGGRRTTGAFGASRHFALAPSSQRVPASQRKKSFQPLVSEQTELVPSVTHVFTQDQRLYLQYEIYDAAKAKPSASAGGGSENKSGHQTVRVLTSIEFLQGDAKVYETKPIVAQEVTAPDRKAVVFQMEIPLQSLKPGFYTCQINVIDDVAGNYAFPRWPILIKTVGTAPGEVTSSGAGRASR